MPDAPAAALVMHPVVMDEILRPDHIDRLQRVCTMPEPRAFRDLALPPALAAEVEVLVTSWGCPRLDPEPLEHLPKLRLVAHLAGSVKGFIDDRVWARGIQVTNAVAANAVPVAEYTLAAILFANKKVFRLQQFYRTHRENRAPWSREAPNVGNYRKTVGIVGASATGRRVVDLLRHFQLFVQLYDPYVSAQEARAMGVRKVDLRDLLRTSDVVSLHAPLLPDTQQLIGAEELRLLPDGATLVNTARGGLVDQDALLAELSSGRIDAVLDTTVPEVLPPDSPFYDLPNVFLTPHIAGSLGDETQRMADYIIDEVERFASGRPLHFQVRREHLHRLA